MFGPTHTVESVVKELIEGLEQGTIVLREEDLPQVNVQTVTKQLEDTLATSRRKELLLLITAAGAGILGIAIAVISILWGPATATEGDERWPIVLVLAISTLAGMTAGLAFALLKTREKTVELKTYSRVLKMADEVTAHRLASKVASKLPRDTELAR